MASDPTREQMIAALRAVIHRQNGVIAYQRGPMTKEEAEEHAALESILRELEAGGWRPRATAPDTDDPILGYSPIAGNPDEDEQGGHYAITEGSFLLRGGWATCTLWRPIAPPATGDGGKGNG